MTNSQSPQEGAMTCLARVGLLIISITLLFVESVNAQWSPDPTLNNSVCSALRDQSFPKMISDGAGGAIVTWEDLRNDPLFPDVYTQRINAAGVIQWQADGVPVCALADDQSDQQITPDNAGGAIIAWNDRRNGSYYRVFVQRFGQAGNSLWATNGALACTTIASQLTPSVVGDGTGGAIVAWVDYRTQPASGTDIYAQRLDANGLRQWGNAASKVCSVRNDQLNPQIISDGEGGAFVVWQDSRILANRDIYVQRITSMGLRQWSDSGLAICQAPGEQRRPRVASDGQGGIIVVWEDLRNGASNVDVYAQRVTASGGIRWQADGVPICTNVSNQFVPEVATHSLGGAIVVWQDNRPGTNSDIYAQSIDTAGTVRWAVDGAGICTSLQGQSVPVVVPDGAGGSLIAWADARNGGSDVYAQRLSASGTSLWTANGVPVSIATSDQNNPQIAPNNTGGAILAWEDLRNNLTTRIDIYASRVNSSGTLASVSHSSVPGEFVLHQNSPNPFNPTTTIKYQIPHKHHVTIKIFDLLGREITTLVNEEMSPGTHTVTWDAAGYTSGVYFYRITADRFTDVKRLLLLR